MIMNFSDYAERLKNLSSVNGASKSAELIGTKFKSLLSISGEILTGKEFKAALSAEQLTKFSWLGDEDLTVKSGTISVQLMDGNSKSFWLNTAVLSQLIKGKCLLPNGDINPKAMGVPGTFLADRVLFAKAEKVEVKKEDEDEDSPF